MKINLDQLSEPELIELNHKIVERLRLMHQIKSHKEMFQFKIGDRVKFHPPGHGSPDHGLGRDPLRGPSTGIHGWRRVRWLPGPGVRPGFSAPLSWGHGFMCDLQPPGDTNNREHTEPLRSYYAETLPELESRLGPIRAHVKKINLTLFPHASFTTSSNMLHVWHPRGPNQTEVWLYVIVDKDAPTEVKRTLRQSAQRHFSPAGMFEQDDMDNWELSTKAAGGTVSRHYPLNYSMGLGHEKWEDDGVVSRQINAINDESNQRAFYYGWSDFMSGDGWDALRRRREEWEGERPSANGGARGG